MVTRVLTQVEWVTFHQVLFIQKKLMIFAKNTYIRQLLMQ